MTLRALIIFGILPGFLLASLCSVKWYDKNKAVKLAWRCCDGYEVTGLSKGLPNCQPKCKSPCDNGTCVSPEKCKCNDDYEQNPFNRCVPICPNGCLNGRCEAPKICTCDEGYMLKGPGHCAPFCDQGCLNGFCESPGNCSCNAGYTQVTNLTCRPICTHECDPDRICVAPNTCGCRKGYAFGSLCLAASIDFLSDFNKSWMIVILLVLIALSCLLLWLRSRNKRPVGSRQSQMTIFNYVR